MYCNTVEEQSETKKTVAAGCRNRYSSVTCLLRPATQTIYLDYWGRVIKRANDSLRLVD
jgi:hypothetical protein